MMGPARFRCQCEGRAPTLKLAKAGVRSALQRFKAANEMTA